MTSLFLPPTITTLLLLCLFPLATKSATNAYIMDEDGEPLLNGGTYYILLQTTTNGGGLTAVPPNAASSSCPLYITQETDPTSNGLPIKITSSINSKYLPFGSTILSFANATTTSCTKPLVWRTTPDSATGNFYVAAGASDQQVDASAFNIIVPFNYVHPSNYVINLCNKLVCASVGMYEENGLLGMNNDVNFQVRFRKALHHGSSEPTTFVM